MAATFRFAQVFDYKICSLCFYVVIETYLRILCWAHSLNFREFRQK